MAINGTVVALSLSLVLGTATARADAPLLVVPADPEFGPGSGPVVAPTGDGYAVVWWDYRDWGTPGRPYGGLRFVRANLAGAAAGPPTLLSLDDPFEEPGSAVRLEAVRGGYVAFAQIDLSALHTIRLDALGVQHLASNPIIQTVELHPASVGATATGMVVTWSEWLGGFGTWSLAVDGEGFAVGSRQPMSLPGLASPSDPACRCMYDAPIACDGNGCVSAWSTDPSGVSLRELSNRAVPGGGPFTVTTSADYGDTVGVASVSSSTAIVYTAGHDQKDIFLVVRGPSGRLSNAVPIADEPYDEGGGVGLPVERPLRVVDGGDRVGVLYVARPTGSSGGPTRWFFSEFDLQGHRLGPRRDLLAEFGLDATDEVDFRRDAVNDRYVVAWTGRGPAGPGVYVLALTPSR